MKRIAKVGEEGEDIDAELSDLGGDGESDGEGEPVSTKITRTLGKIDTAYKPVPVMKSLD